MAAVVAAAVVVAVRFPMVKFPVVRVPVARVPVEAAVAAVVESVAPVGPQARVAEEPPRRQSVVHPTTPSAARGSYIPGI